MGRDGGDDFRTQVGLALDAEHNRPRVSYLLEGIALQTHVVWEGFLDLDDGIACGG